MILVIVLGLLHACFEGKSCLANSKYGLFEFYEGGLEKGLLKLN